MHSSAFFMSFSSYKPGAQNTPESGQFRQARSVLRAKSPFPGTSLHPDCPQRTPSCLARCSARPWSGARNGGIL